MKGLRFGKSKSIIVPKPDGAEARPGILGRFMADVRNKEYAVFVKPVLRPFKGKSGSAAADHAFKELDALPPAPPQVSKPETAPQPVAPPVLPVYQDPAEEDVVDPRLVEEIFARSAPPPIQPEMEHELAEWDSGVPVPAVVAPKEPEEPRVAQPTNDLVSEADKAVETIVEQSRPTVTTQSQPAKSPLVRTMVEAMPDKQANGEGGLGDFLSDDLQDIFNTGNYLDPRTKALLKSREYVDVHELARELKEYARSIGAVPTTQE